MNYEKTTGLKEMTILWGVPTGYFFFGKRK
jgi:hypothetical protein